MGTIDRLEHCSPCIHLKSTAFAEPIRTVTSQILLVIKALQTPASTNPEKPKKGLEEWSALRLALSVSHKTAVAKIQVYHQYKSLIH